MATDPVDPVQTKPPSRVLSRPIALAVSLVSLAVFLGSSLAMVPRIRAYYEGRTDLEKPRRFAFQIISEPEFTYAGVPVRFAHVPGDTPETDQVRVTYGDAQLLLPDRVPGIAELPDLTRYENWLKVVRFVETTGRSVTETQRLVEAGEVRDRLALAVRIPPPGADEQTWGRVKRSEWRFETHEFLPPEEGVPSPESTVGFNSESWVTPESQRAYLRRVERAARNNEPIPQRREDELKQGTWQHDAAQLTMPDSRGYAPVFGADAFEAFGWTFPVAGVSAIVMPIALAFLFAPRREDIAARD